MKRLLCSAVVFLFVLSLSAVSPAAAEDAGGALDPNGFTGTPVSALSTATGIVRDGAQP